MVIDVAEGGFGSFGNRFIVAGGWSDYYVDYSPWILQYDSEAEDFVLLPEQIHYPAEANVALLTGEQRLWLRDLKSIHNSKCCLVSSSSSR